MDVEKLRAERADVLRQIYEAAEGDPSHVVRFKEQVTGYDLDALEKHVQYLSGRGLLNRIAMGFLSITPQGVDEAEHAAEETSPPVEIATAPSTSASPESHTSWVYNPWLVTIVGAVVAALIVVLILALVN